MINEHGGLYDIYGEAQAKNREVVRLPTRFSWEGCQSAERHVIDQFIAGTFPIIRIVASSYGCLVHV
jgi:hypothetical protein